MNKIISALMLTALLAAFSASGGETECTITESGQIVCQEICGIWGHCP